MPGPSLAPHLLALSRSQSPHFPLFGVEQRTDRNNRVGSRHLIEVELLHARPEHLPELLRLLDEPRDVFWPLVAVAQVGCALKLNCLVYVLWIRVPLQLFAELGFDSGTLGLKLWEG